MYGAVVPTCSAQAVDVIDGHRIRGTGKLFSILHQRRCRRVETGATPVRLNSVCEFVIDLCPEIVPVRFHSIVAVVHLRDRHRQHFTLASGKRRRTVHDLRVQSRRCGKHLGVRAHQPQDVPDLPCPADGKSILVAENSLRGFRGDSTDVGHQSSIEPEGVSSPPLTAIPLAAGSGRYDAFLVSILCREYFRNRNGNCDQQRFHARQINELENKLPTRIIDV